MEIIQVTEGKKDYIDMLLLADPSEERIDRYLDKSDMFVLVDAGDAIAVGVVEVLKNRCCELKNIATAADCRGQGYGRYMIHYICEHYSNCCDTIYVRTENDPSRVAFYNKCGFVNSHIVADPAVNMIYLRKSLDSEIDMKRVVDLALEAGRILLKNGGEIFRVEETIQRICRRFHVDNVDLFIISHGLFVTAENEEGEVYTKVKHVPLSSAHLEIVAEVNELSRAISAGKMGLDEAERRLKEIDQIPSKSGRFQIAAAGVGSGIFAVLLGSGIPEGIAACIIGCLCYVWVLFAKKHNMSKIIVNIAGGVIMTVLAVLMMHIPGLPPLRLEGMISGAIMPLIPGVAFVNSIRDIADSDFLSGTVRMIDALLVFVYIAAGVGATLSIYNTMIGGLSI